MANLDVLVVEDDPDINKLIGAYVKLAGYNYRSALSGALGLRAAKEKPPGLIILDVMLSDSDGFEICRKLRSLPKTADVPILMLTAMTQDEHRQRGLASGANGYMTKPFDPDALMDAIREYFKGDRSTASFPI